MSVVSPSSRAWRGEWRAGRAGDERYASPAGGAGTSPSTSRCTQMPPSPVGAAETTAMGNIKHGNRGDRGYKTWKPRRWGI